MSALRKEVPSDLPPGVAVVTRAEELSAIFNPDIDATIWNRNPPAFQDWVDALSPDHLPDVCLTLRTDAVREAVGEILQSAGVPSSPHRQLLINDIVLLSDQFTNRVASQYVRLRLEKVDDDACCKFHKDAMTIRLICTCRGPGSQYGLSIKGADPDPHYTVPTFSPILLRGSRLPASADVNIVHRSPPIEGTSQTRLVLVLDPVSEAELES